MQIGISQQTQKDTFVWSTCHYWHIWKSKHGAVSR